MQQLIAVAAALESVAYAFGCIGRHVAAHGPLGNIDPLPAVDTLKEKRSNANNESHNEQHGLAAMRPALDNLAVINQALFYARNYSWGFHVLPDSCAALEQRILLEDSARSNMHAPLFKCRPVVVVDIGCNVYHFVGQRA